MRGFGACVLGDLQSHLSALDCIERRLVVEIGSGSLQVSLGAGLGFFRAFDVDVLHALGSLREDSHFLRQNLGKSPGNRKVLSRALLLV